MAAEELWYARMHTHTHTHTHTHHHQGMTSYHKLSSTVSQTDRNP